jgi:hypothetical protein
MGLRRETVKVLPETGSPGGIQLQADVEAFEPDFVHRHQTVFLRMGRVLFSGLCPLENRLHMGQQVPVVIHPENLYFFDTHSGRRL